MRHSIRTQLTVAFIGLAIVPLLIAGTGMVWESFIVQREQALVLQQQIGANAANRAAAFISDLERELLLLAQIQGTAPLNEEEQRLLLSGALSRNEAFATLIMLDENGREQTRVSREDACITADSTPSSPPDEFTTFTTSGQTHFGPILFDEGTAEPFMTMAVSALDERNELSQIALVANICLQQFWDSLAETEVGESGNLYIINQQQEVVAHRNPSLHGVRLDTPRQEGIRSGLQGNRVVLTSTAFPTEKADLFLITERPLSEAFNLTIIALIRTGGFILLVLLIATTLGVVLIRRITKPVEALAATVQAVTAGDLSKRVPVNHQNELGTLAQAFNAMISKLQETTASLEQRVNERTQALSKANSELKAEIAERERIAKVLGENQQELRSLLENSPDIIARFDKDLRYVYINAAVVKQLGMPPGAFIGRTSLEAGMDPENAKLWMDAIESVFETGKQRKHYTVHQTKRGVRHYQTILAPVRALDGSVTSVLTITRNITEQKRMEKQLKASQKELQKNLKALARSNRELEQFAYVASHDLQEPLRMVASYVKLLARRYQEQLDEDADEFIAFAVEGAERMQQLINDLLAYSRVGTHGKAFAPVDCQAIVERTIHDLQMAIQENDATVTCDALPTVTGDESQLTQLFQNLISNAIKFRREAPPQVHISAVDQEGEWRFAVRDNGIGIEPEYRERIFTIFQRLHSRKTYAGTGIGLAICQKIVDRHNGRIWVESQPNQGATFYFTIPVQEAT